MRQRGFTYLGLLFAIAFIGLLLATVGESWQTALRREREAELLFVGRQFARAIAAYRDATPHEPKQLPRRIEDLLEDRRGLVLRRHLRRIYADPFTGRTEWGLIKFGEFIVGVHSRGEGRPFKQADFLPGEEAFAGAASYRDWRFMAQQESATPAMPN